MRNRDEVRLIVSGQDFTGWTDVSIHMAIAQLADTFTLSAPFNPGDNRLIAAIKPYSYQPVKIYLGDDLYHSGRLDAQSFSLTSSGRTVSLSGRSLPGILCDCSAEGCAELNDLSFFQIASKICKPFNLKIRDDAALAGKIASARSEYGQNAFDFLHSLAAPHNLLLNSSYDGEVVISSGDSLVSRSVVADIAEGDSNIMEIGSSFNSSERYSIYKSASQFAGATDIEGSVTDKAISLYRPLLAIAGETDADPRTTAARMMAELLAKSLTVTVKLSGWRRPDGKLWAERQAVTLIAPSVYLSKRTRYVISDVELSLTPTDGRTVTLSLTPPELYSSALIKANRSEVSLW